MPRRAAPRSPAVLPAPQGEGGARWSGGFAFTRPTSTNGLYRIGKDRASGRRRVILSARYAAWRAEFSGEMLLRRHTLPRALGAFEIVVLIGRRKGLDLDNHVKGLLDALQHHGVIEDDKLCECLTVRWTARLNSKQAAFFIRPAREVVNACAA